MSFGARFGFALSLFVALPAAFFAVVLSSGCSSQTLTSPPAPPSTAETASAPPQEKPAKGSPDDKAEAPKEDGSKPAKPFPLQLTSEELAAGWISLFDGETLFGWRPVTKANWAVTDGTITVSEGEAGLLCTSVPFSDYEFQVDFRFAPGTNSGIFLHSPQVPKDPAKDCYELNIAEPSISPFPTGSFVGRAKGEGDAGAAAPDEWHHYDVHVEGAHVVVKLDGKQVLDYTDPQPLRRGYIGLQLNKGAVAFRNLKLRPHGLKPLFNGKDLTGWKEYPELKSRFSVTPAGELHVQDGRGQLETTESFGDFVVQLECRTGAPKLNSGLFFRCIPGQEMLGYESQIHNGVKDGDRAKPLDCGTGGIFRRVDARAVAADDLTWFTKTIVAVGPDVSVWVNGYQVTQWTDERAPDENPRKGLRTAAGTFQIQGHDPTTDILFRNLRATEMAPRIE